MRSELSERIEASVNDEAELATDRHPELVDLAARHGLDELIDRFNEGDRRMLSKVDAALRRIDDGSYGTCPVCGDGLSVDRLLALPEAELCEDCQALEESGFPL